MALFLPFEHERWQDPGVNSLRGLCPSPAYFTSLTECSGYVARARKAELEKINNQLRQINISLRRQARLESYAPSLSYAPAPVTGKTAAALVASPELAGVGSAVESTSDKEATATVTTEVASAVESSPSRRSVLRRLREGKRFLREQQPALAFGEFQEALKLAREVGDAVEEKKAARGLGKGNRRDMLCGDATGMTNGKGQECVVICFMLLPT